MIALLAALALTIPQAKQAMTADAKLDHAQHIYVNHCQRLSKHSVRCLVTEENRSIEDGIESIVTFSGHMRATLEHSYIRIHRE